MTDQNFQGFVALNQIGQNQETANLGQLMMIVQDQQGAPLQQGRLK